MAPPERKVLGEFFCAKLWYNGSIIYLEGRDTNMALFHKNRCWLVTARLWDYVSDDVVDYIEGISTVTPPDDEDQVILYQNVSFEHVGWSGLIGGTGPLCCTDLTYQGAHVLLNCFGQPAYLFSDSGQDIEIVLRPERKIRTLTIETGITSIERGALSGMIHLSKLIVPATVHTISSDMFYPSDIHDYGLNTIRLKSADTRIIGDFSGITIHQRKK